MCDLMFLNLQKKYLHNFHGNKQLSNSLVNLHYFVVLWIKVIVLPVNDRPLG